jgi:hypothetical protein
MEFYELKDDGWKLLRCFLLFTAKVCRSRVKDRLVEVVSSIRVKHRIGSKPKL